MNITVRSAARVLDLLEYLALRADRASLGDCATALGLPKSSTLMLLRTVVERGYVERDQSGRYGLNETFRRLGFGWGGQRHARLIAMARPVMASLSEEVGETVILAAAGGPTGRHLAKHVSEQIIRYDFELATEIPYYCTAIGRVLMAYASADQQEAMLGSGPWKAYTSKTVTDPIRLREIIGEVRAAGYAVVEEEYAIGGTGVSAPIFGPGGDVLAVLDIGCVTSRYHDKSERLIDALQVAANDLTRRLGAELLNEASLQSDLNKKHDREQ